MKPLTDTQTLILNNASKRTDGNIEPMPDNINAGIKPRVIEGLLKRELAPAFRACCFAGPTSRRCHETATWNATP